VERELKNFPTIRCEREKKDTPLKSLLYSSDSGFAVEIKGRNVSWKYAGGGLEGSAHDLANFAQALIDNKMLTQSRRNTMTGGMASGPRYAYGWNYNTHNSMSWFGKSGGQEGARTYVRAYPIENIVIVILNNALVDERLENLTTSIARMIRD
jgi:CubicO group peptidase (beta-lactamase class C family)